MTTKVSGYNDLILRPATGLEDDFPLADPRQVCESGMFIDYDVAVDVRTGGHIDIDLYRPDTVVATDLPTIVAWGAFGKHDRGIQALFAGNHGVDPDWISEYTPFEAPDPVYWTSQGYAVAIANPRGTWNSPGDYSHGDISEAEDYYDLVEWLGTQTWSNGKVGITGVSYLARSAYAVAAQQPPHLAAIAPFEAFVDMYREFAFHGGIPETRFVPMVSSRCGRGRGMVEDMVANFAAHPLLGHDDEFWASKSIATESITVPTFVVASWGDQGLHTRGTLDFYTSIAARDKWLEIHGRKKWQYFYQPSTIERVTAFFDRYLKGQGDGLDARPRVSLEIRETVDVGTVRAETEWPPARAEFVPLRLDTRSGTLSIDAPVAESTSSYDTQSGRAVFEHTFAEDTELTGYMGLKLWISTDVDTDADIFVAVEKVDPDGVRVPQIYYATFTDGPVAQGWLRASHRALDPDRSTPIRPIHRHTHEQPLEPGVPVCLDVEIWPSSTLFRAGERLRLIVAGTDIYDEIDPGLPFDSPWPRHTTRNTGRHTLHTGGAFDSHLLVPQISPT